MHDPYNEDIDTFTNRGCGMLGPLGAPEGGKMGNIMSKIFLDTSGYALSKVYTFKASFKQQVTHFEVKVRIFIYSVI